MSNYKFSLKVDQLEFSVGGDKEFVESYMEKWLVLFKDKIPNELIGEAQEEAPRPAPVVNRGKLSMTDFIKLKSPKSYNDLMLTVFFYNERYEGMENTGVGAKVAYDFLQKLPNAPAEESLNAVLEKLVEENFLQVLKGTEANPKYQVTFTGEQCVKQGFAE